MDGLSNVNVRPKIELRDFVEKGAVACGVTLDDLRSRKRRSGIVEARELLAWLGVIRLPVSSYISPVSKLGAFALTPFARSLRFVVSLLCTSFQRVSSMMAAMSEKTCLRVTWLSPRFRCLVPA